MKALFLDNDGVICLSNNWGGRGKKWKEFIKLNPEITDEAMAPVDIRFDNFDEKAIKVLNEILEETNAEIIVSSDWRFHATLDEIGEYYLSKGISKKPIGFTKQYFNCDNPDEFEWNRITMYEQQRCIEIKQYLIDHPEVTNWVCVDDLQLGKKFPNRIWGISNFVHTPKQNEGIKQSGVKDKIIKYLKSNG